ncbi:methyltransferase [Actinocorallia sp. B10E7]|uniref:methyltransferase n=1 Tax=Actinocorallia sp. B10E7 TaxID=3153558 RepID=UPI00325CD699
MTVTTRWTPEEHVHAPRSHKALEDLADLLRSAGFTGERVARLLGASSPEDLLRNSAMYALWSHDREHDLVSTMPGLLVQLFVRNGEVAEHLYLATVPAELRRILESLGLAAVEDGRVTSQVSLSPFGPLLLLSDPVFRCRTASGGKPAMVPDPDPVMPPHGSTLLLHRHLQPHGRRLLDLGCGSGALGLISQAAEVSGVDVLPRAAAFSNLNAVLNRRPAGFRTGDYRSPLGPARSVDHLVFNAPGRAPGKDESEDPELFDPARLLREAAKNIVELLADGGLAQLLLIVAVPESRRDVAGLVRDRVPKLDRITGIRVTEAKDPSLGISARAISRGHIPPGCLLVEDPVGAAALMTALRRREIHEVRPVVLSIAT